MYALIYFGMMPIILFIALVVSKLNPEKFDVHDGVDTLELLILLVLWPSWFLVAIALGLTWIVYVIINLLANGTVYVINLFRR